MVLPTTPRPPTPATSSRLAASSTSPATPSSAFMVQDDMDDPTATPTAYIRATAPPAQNQDSDGEDDAPDYLRLLSTLNPRSKSTRSTSATNSIVIPKRGEKDFEPTGFGGQAKLLERSRDAMFQAVSGERRVGSRSLVRATWDGRTRRARLHDVQGKIFETVGVIRREYIRDESTGKMVTKAWNELLPEEALFLAERGSLQIYQPCATQGAEHEVGNLAPMSLQQAFTALMLPTEAAETEDEPLTREGYLIYAYLKRLGYVVQRASVVDAVRAAPMCASTLAKKKLAPASWQDQSKRADAEGIIADPQRPVKLVTVWDVMLYMPRRIAQLGGDAARAVVKWVEWVWRKMLARFIAAIAAAATRVVGCRASTNAASLGLALDLHGRQDGRRFVGDKRAVEWDSYDAVFSSLQIVPSGHDFWLPSASNSSATGRVEEDACSTVQQTVGWVEGMECGLKPFYYAWRPATLYRKSHPPPPEFRIVMLNARTTPVPSIWQLESMFARIPIPGSDQELFNTLGATGSSTDGEPAAMSEQELKQRLEYEKKLKASNDAKNRAAYGKLSEGKQKHLREKAAARQAATAAQRLESNRATHSGVAKRLSTSGIGRMLVKLLLVDLSVLRLVARFFRHCPPGCWSDAPKFSGRSGGKWKGRNGAASSGRGGVGNPFAALKAGRRTVVVAVVDGSITTLLRLGESEFGHWALYGTQAAPQQRKAGERKHSWVGTQPK